VVYLLQPESDKRVQSDGAESAKRCTPYFRSKPSEARRAHGVLGATDTPVSYLAKAHREWRRHRREIAFPRGPVVTGTWLTGRAQRGHSDNGGTRQESQNTVAGRLSYVAEDALTRLLEQRCFQPAQGDAS
jgi:hypothetical protein